MSIFKHVVPGLALILSVGLTAQTTHVAAKAKLGSKFDTGSDAKVPSACTSASAGASVKAGGNVDIAAIIDMIMKLIKMFGGKVPVMPLDALGGGDQDKLLPFVLSEDQIAQVKAIRGNASTEADPLIRQAAAAEKACTEAFQDPSVSSDQLKVLLAESQKAQGNLILFMHQVDLSVKSVMSSEQLAKLRAYEGRIGSFGK